jgi:aliphatic nitrilase
MSINPTKLRVAAVQAAPSFLDLEKTLDKACELIVQAGTEGADIIVFPEVFISGYCHWLHYYTPGHPMSIKLNRKLFKSAVEIPSPATDQLCEAARKANAYVVMGLNERRQGGMPGTLYNTMLFIHRDGTIMGKHQKMMPTFIEKIVHAIGDGSTLQVFQTEYGPLGGLACGENGNPLLRFALYAQGEVLHAAGWPSYTDIGPSRLTHDLMLLRMRNCAFEGRIFVISAAEIFTQEMADMMELDNKTREAISSAGGYSAILGPMGQYLAGPAEYGETILYADLDMDELIDARYRQDVTGHYNRFDVVSLNYNGKANIPINFKEEDTKSNLTLPDTGSSGN